MQFKGSVLSLILLASSNAFTFKTPFPPSSQQLTKVSSSATALSMGLTLYGHPGTRSPLVNWACHELKVDFEMGDLSKNPHPFGQLPCMTDDDDAVIFESGAILQYLHKYYAPPQDTLSKKLSSQVISWITWANASLDPICFLETPDGKVYDTGLRRPNKRIDRLNAILEKQEYLVDGTFTLADVAVSSYLLYVLQFFPDVDLSKNWPSVARYARDCAIRPAYGKAFGSKVQNYLLSKLESSPTSPKKMFGMF